MNGAFRFADSREARWAEFGVQRFTNPNLNPRSHLSKLTLPRPISSDSESAPPGAGLFDGRRGQVARRPRGAGMVRPNAYGRPSQAGGRASILRSKQHWKQRQTLLSRILR